MESIDELASNLPVQRKGIVIEQNNGILNSNSSYINCQPQSSDCNNSSLNVQVSENGNICVSSSEGSITKEVNGASNAGKDCRKLVMHIEVCVSSRCVEPYNRIEKEVQKYLASWMWSEFSYLREASEKGLHSFLQFEDNKYLKQHIVFMKVEDEATCFDSSKSSSVNKTRMATLKADKVVLEIVLHTFTLSNDLPGIEELTAVSGEDECVSAAQIWMLPNVQFKSLWDSLFYEDDLKWRLVRYVETMLLFSDRNIDQNIITYNRVVLLHGPPGTGKTSLCQALAQRLSIRLSKRYRYCQLVEINSHSLFSRWFSESGKLVTRMFEKIRELCSDPNALIFILIDEVESLAASRQSSSKGMEPSDAIRVVNAMLTQLDQLKSQTNVVVLTTSNLSGRVDLAFVDRADIKEKVGLPSPLAAYAIIRSCVGELMTRGLIFPQQELLQLPASTEKLRSDDMSRRLFNICCSIDDSTDDISALVTKAASLQGLSGRTMRKLPFLAIASHCDHSWQGEGGKLSVTLPEFLTALQETVFQYKQQMKLIEE